MQGNFQKLNKTESMSDVQISKASKGSRSNTVETKPIKTGQTLTDPLLDGMRATGSKAVKALVPMVDSSPGAVGNASGEKTGGMNPGEGEILAGLGESDKCSMSLPNDKSTSAPTSLPSGVHANLGAGDIFAGSGAKKGRPARSTTNPMAIQIGNVRRYLKALENQYSAWKLMNRGVKDRQRSQLQAAKKEQAANAAKALVEAALSGDSTSAFHTAGQQIAAELFPGSHPVPSSSSNCPPPNGKDVASSSSCRPMVLEPQSGDSGESDAKRPRLDLVNKKG